MTAIAGKRLFNFLIAANVRGFALCGLIATRFDTEENGRFNFFKKWAQV
jgi:hypothetical protein